MSRSIPRKNSGMCTVPVLNNMASDEKQGSASSHAWAEPVSCGTDLLGIDIDPGCGVPDHDDILAG